MVGTALVVVAGFALRDDGVSAQPDPTQLARELVGLTSDDVLHEWTENAVSRCMRGADFPFEARPYEPVQTEGLDVPAAERAGRGFGLSTRTTGPQPLDYDDPVARIASNLGDARRDAFFAQLEQCGAQVADQAEQRRAAVLDQLSPEDSAWLEGMLSGSDGAAEAATSAWSSCMEQAGHPYASQQEMLMTLQDKWYELAGTAPAQLKEFGDLERGVAVADAACDSAHLAPYREAALDELAQRLSHYPSVEAIYTTTD